MPVAVIRRRCCHAGLQCVPGTFCFRPWGSDKRKTFALCWLLLALGSLMRCLFGVVADIVRARAVFHIAQDLGSRFLAFCWNVNQVLTFLGGFWGGELPPLQPASCCQVCWYAYWWSAGSVAEWGALAANSPVVAGLRAFYPGSLAPVWVARAVWSGRVSLSPGCSRFSARSADPLALPLLVWAHCKCYYFMHI